MQPEGVVFDTATQPRGEGEMRELARLADSLVEQLGETRRHYEQLRTDLDRYEPRPATPSATAPAESEADEETYEESHERVRLFALNLALSGETRETVSDQLRDKFDIADATDILDIVFPRTEARARKRRFGRRRGS